jgi:hypothetical protein
MGLAHGLPVCRPGWVVGVYSPFPFTVPDFWAS